MESNKDEAIRCIDIATNFIHEKNLKNARKFLKKSLKLYPSPKAQDLLNSILNLPDFKACIEDKKEHFPKPVCRSQKPDKLEKRINDVLSSNDYYDVLGVEKNATEKEIKKSYRKLALLLHPDKTQITGAAEAFKAVRNAVSILTDQTKRRQYDIYGSEVTHASASCTSFRSTFSENRNSDSSDNSNRNIFEEDGEGIYGYTTKHEVLTIKLILPIIFAIALTCVTTIFMHDPTYSLQKSLKYPIVRYTQNLKIPYYVKDNFLIDNSGLEIAQLDNEIEIETITNLQYACYNEKSYRVYLLQLARERRNSSFISDILEMRLPSCENLYEMQRVRYT